MNTIKKYKDSITYEKIKNPSLFEKLRGLIKKIFSEIFVREKNSYLEHFKEEWNYFIRNFTNKDSQMDLKVYSDFKKVIVKALKIWGKQGHSGFSANFFAPRIAGLLKKAMLFEPFSSIQKGEEEFYEMALGRKNMFQSRRCSALFKNKNKKPYYLDAIIWKDQNGSTFTGTVNGITSRQYINYPFYPKSFIVEIYEDKKTLERKIIDKKTLKEALTYYKPYTKEAKEFLKNYENGKIK